MTLTPTAETAVFDGQDIEVLGIDGTPWIRGCQLCHPLGVSERTIKRLYKRHKSEFTEGMTAVVELPTEGGPQLTRLFSPRGAALIAMLANTERAARFRAWVLDVLEARPAPAADPAPGAPTAVLTALQEEVLRARPRWQAIRRYAGMGLGRNEIARLLSLDPATVRKERRRMEACGLIAPPAGASWGATPAGTTLAVPGVPDA